MGKWDKWQSLTVGSKVREKSTGKIAYVVDRWATGAIFIAENPKDEVGVSRSPSDLEKVED